MRTQVYAPFAGRILLQSQIPDPVFSQGLVGPAFALVPTPSSEFVDVVSPVAGTLTRVMPHAFVVSLGKQTGIMVHLGIDTVKAPEGVFMPVLQQGQQVSAGQTVCRMVPDMLAQVGTSAVSPIVAMGGQFEDVSDTEAQAGQALALLVG